MNVFFAMKLKRSAIRFQKRLEALVGEAHQAQVLAALALGAVAPEVEVPVVAGKCQ